MDPTKWTTVELVEWARGAPVMSEVLRLAGLREEARVLSQNIDAVRAELARRVSEVEAA